VLLHYPAKRETRKLYLSLAALREFNLLLLDFFNLFDSRLIFMLLYDSLNLVINAFSLGLFGGMVQEKGSREHCSIWTVLHAWYKATVRCLLDFLFCKVMLKHQIGEMRKQSVRFLTFSVTLLPEIIAFGLRMSRL